MMFRDGSGSVTLQNFTLADGQICVKAEYHWAQPDAMGSMAVYPTPENYDWFGAAVKIAQGWMSGPASNATPVEVESAMPERLIAAS